MLVVAGDGPALLGRDWLRKICLDWAQTAYSTSTSVPSLQALCDEYNEVFTEELGTVKQIQATLRVRKVLVPSSSSLVMCHWPCGKPLTVCRLFAVIHDKASAAELLALQTYLMSVVN